MPVRLTLLAVVPALLLACGGTPDAESSGGSSTASRAASRPAARLTVAEFGRLRWLEGRWLGSEGSGAPFFFEAYRFLDDSTIRSYEFADSSMTVARDSGLIQWRADTVTSGGASPRWIGVRFDSVSAEFSAIGNPSNGFTWTFEGPGAWSARLTWDSSGVARSRVYTMRARR